MSTEDSRDERIRELDERVRERDERNRELEKQLCAALNRISELERRLGLNSNNSSKPPSSDGLRRTQSLRGKSGKLKGGQPNHRGATLKMVSNPDKIEPHIAEFCQDCQARLSQSDARVAEKRQVLDLPAIALEVTEHQVLETTCSNCGAVNRGSFPKYVKA